jgi:hypothetical protein
MSTIKSSTTTTTAYQVVADTTGTLVLQTGATPTTAVTIGSDQSVTFAGAVSLSGNQTTTGNLTVNGNTTLGDASTDTILMTGAPSIGGAGLGMGMGFRNRIINGAMVIDQRNSGAAVTLTSGGDFVTDRFIAYEDTDGTMTGQQVLKSANSGNAPTGFSSSLLFTTGTADASLAAAQFVVINQNIEGLNVSDLDWGTANASTITLSFYVKSSLTGTFGGSLRNSTGSRSYPFSYSIPTANTWTQISITIAGDTSGTWLTTNGIGIRLIFSLGAGATFSGTAGAWVAANYYSVTSAVSVVGTASATFYITGVQLEKGSTATSFDYRPYGTELALCQRYYQTVKFSSTGTCVLTTAAYISVTYQMRSAPSVGTPSIPVVLNDGFTNFTQSAAAASAAAAGNETGLILYLPNFTGLTIARFCFVNNGALIPLSAEL